MVDQWSDDDETVTVTLPKRDYVVLREIIQERQAMSGFKNWIQSRVFWLAGGLLSIVGLIEFFRSMK